MMKNESSDSSTINSKNGNVISFTAWELTVQSDFNTIYHLTSLNKCKHKRYTLICRSDYCIHQQLGAEMIVTLL